MIDDKSSNEKLKEAMTQQEINKVAIENKKKSSKLGTVGKIVHGAYRTVEKM